MQNKSGLLVGRFQPFHKGHLYLIKKALENVDTLTIGIGSSNISDEKNPFSFEKRKQMLGKVLKEEGIEDKVKKIVGIADDPSDDVWLKNTLELTGAIDIYFGNDEWTTGIFEKAGLPVLRIPYFRRDLYEGTLIREIIKNGEDWKDRVPSYLIPMIQHEEK